MNDKTKVCLNNVVYDLTQIENPHLKKAMQTRNYTNNNFLHLFDLFKRYKEHTEYTQMGNWDNELGVMPGGRDHLEHTDIPANWQEHSETTYDQYSCTIEYYDCG